MATCYKCGGEDADKTYRFVVVDKRTSSQRQNYVVATKTTTTVYEKFVGIKRVCICDSCVKKERNVSTIQGIGFIFLGAACFLLLLLIKQLFNAYVAFVFLAIAVVCSVILVVYNFKRAFDIFAGNIMSKLNKCKDTTVKFLYISVDQDLYLKDGKPDFEKFKQVSNLRTSVADALYEKFIKPGNGEEIVDSMLANNTSDS